LDISHLQTCMRRNIGEWTFQEAYERSGRIVNGLACVCVCVCVRSGRIVNGHSLC
jgi:hypothetical protein